VTAWEDTSAVPRVSIIIPTQNAGPQFQDTLAAIARYSGGLSYELIIIDSGSSDETVPLAEQHGARVLCIPPAEFSHGRTRNEAIASARGEYVALIVQDAVPANEHWLTALVEAVESDPQVAGAYSRHVGRATSDYLSRYIAEYWHRRIGRRWVQEIGDPEAFRRLSWDEQRSRYTFDNVSSLIRRSLWQEYPLPNLSYGEDVAWAKQVLEAGYQIVYEPASIVVHSHERPTSYELRRAFIDARTIGRIFPPPARRLSLFQARALLELYDEQCGLAAGQAVADGPELTAEVEAYCAGDDWCRDRFDLLVLRRLLGPESPWDASRRQQLLHTLDEREEQSGNRGWAATIPALQRASRLWWSMRGRPTLSARIESALQGESLSREDLEFIFSQLNSTAERELVRQTVLNSLAERPTALLDSVELDIRSFAGQILKGAAAEGSLSPPLYSRVRQFAAAWVIGRLLGVASLSARGPAEERFWQDLEQRWAPGI